MKRMLFVLSVIFALLAMSGALSVTDCFADSPQIINYQGRLTDTGDNPLTDSYYFTFRLWSHKTSVEAQYYEWAESHGPVTVTNGLFNVILGSVNTDTLGAVFNTNTSLYMEIEVEGETLSPRVEMGSAGYALEAIPSRVIVMWYGQTDTIPDGWVLCDGSNDTPDLRDKFIIGAGNLANPDSKGMGGITPLSGSGDSLEFKPGTDQYMVEHQTGSSGGKGISFDANIIPPYYALAFIMKKRPEQGKQ